MAAKQLGPLRIVSDHVINRENLAFGFDAYASAIAELIATKTNKTPYTIGISGKWGSGKTTLMKAIESKLDQLPHDEKTPIQDQEFRKIKCVWFEAWKYKDDDEILAALIEVVIKKIKADEDFLDRIKKAAKEAGKGSPFENIEKLGKSLNYRKIFSMVSKAALSIDLTDFVKDPETGKSISHEDFLGFYDTFNETFEKVLWEYLGTNNGYKQKDEQAALVIFIDDLDRCPSPKIIQILETIKLFLDKPGCIFVLGAAKDIIEKAMTKAEKYDPKDAEDFLEKIIQINFPLPKKTTKNAEGFLSEIKSHLKIDDKFKDEIIETILPMLDLNPRRVIALFNDVSLQTGMMHHEDNDIEFEKLLLWKALEKYEKGFFNENIMDQGIYKSFMEDVQSYDQAMSDNETKKISEEFKEGLNNPELFTFLSDDSIRKLLNKLELTESEHLILATHSATFKEEEPDEKAFDDFKTYIAEIEKSKTDAPKDFKDFVDIEGGEYDLESIGNKSINSFAIGKYPVTNKWFAEFIHDGGYSSERHWSEDGKKWLQTSKVTEPEYWNDEKFNHPGQPVVGVCWYEAEAFCHWLTANGSGVKRLMRLATEEEWQAAAGGKQALKYPWGNEWNLKYCNNGELGLGKTSVVGVFKKGNSQGTNISDMSGNAWEWTSSLGDKEGRDRVIRGGSWLSVAEHCAVSNRGRVKPDDRDYCLGFRLAHSL